MQPVNTINHWRVEWLKIPESTAGYVAIAYKTPEPNAKTRRMYRNKKLLEAARELPCQHCGISDGTVVAAHSNQMRDGKGRGLKADDYRIASMCFRCHSELDQGAKMSREERLEMWEEAHRKTIGLMFEREIIGLL